MKLTVLVIASDGIPLYAEHQRLWRTYSRSHPDTTVYFVRQREDVAAAYIDGDTIWTSGREAFERVYDKTIDAFKLIPTSSYTYLVRTNLSSVWNFTRLLAVCKKFPRGPIFCGVLGDPGISGAGMILSPDVVSTFVAHSQEIERGKWDDIDFGRLALRCGISPLSGTRQDPQSREDVDRMWDTGYHFYLKGPRLTPADHADEADRMQYLIQKIYTPPTKHLVVHAWYRAFSFRR